MVVSTVLQRNPEVNFEPTLNLDDVSHVEMISFSLWRQPIDTQCNTFPLISIFKCIIGLHWD